MMAFFIAEDELMRGFRGEFAGEFVEIGAVDGLVLADHVIDKALHQAALRLGRACG